MSMVMVNGLRFHYWTIGDGPDVVLIHGLGGNLAIWHLKLVPELRQDYRLTTYDLRGHGHSDIPSTGYTTEDMAADLRGLLDVLGIERAHLIGHSLGADIALHFALRYPDRAGKLVLIEPALSALIHTRKDENWIGWTYWAETIENYTGKKVPEDKRTDYKYLLSRSLDVPILFGPARGQPRKQEKFRQLLESTTLVRDYEAVGELTLENVATIPHPKLLIYDSRSPYIETFHVLCKVATNFTPLLLPPSQFRHFFPLEEPGALVPLINGFLGTDRFELPPTSEDGR